MGLSCSKLLMIGPSNVQTPLCVVADNISFAQVMLIPQIFASSSSETWPLRSCVLIAATKGDTALELSLISVC